MKHTQFHNIDPINHAQALQILNNGVDSSISSNMLARHALLLEGCNYNYDRTAVIYRCFLEVEAAGNFDKAKREQNNKAALRTPDVALIMGGDFCVNNKMLDELCKGNVYDGFEILELVRVGGPQIEDKLKIGSRHIFDKFKLTYYQVNQDTGLLYLRFEYSKYRLETTKFDDYGIPAGVRVTEVRADDNAPGVVL